MCDDDRIPEIYMTDYLGVSPEILRVWAKRQLPGGPSAGHAKAALKMIEENMARLGPVLHRARQLGMMYCILTHEYSDNYKYIIILDGLRYVGHWQSLEDNMEEIAQNMVEWWEGDGEVE